MDNKNNIYRNYTNSDDGGEQYDDRKLLLAVGICILAVLGAVIGCVSLQRCGGKDEPLPPSPIISTHDVSASDSSIKEKLPDFTVTVEGMDGIYSRTEVKEDEAMTLTISGQDENGFDFKLAMNGEGNTNSVSAHADFIDSATARCKLSEESIVFSFGSYGVTVYQSGTLVEFDGIAPDGLFITGTPTYIEDEISQSAQNMLDADIRTTEAVQRTLSEIMSQPDYELMKTLFATGSCPVYQGPEKGYDKNGREINIDSQLKAVKYYAFVQGTGQELILICTADGRVYIGICDGSEYRYYTNDEQYKATPPQAISGQAQTKGMTLVIK